MRSDLMNLPPQTLTQLVWAVLYRSGWTEFTAVGDGAFLMAEDGDGARRVGVVYTPGTDANEMADLIGGWLAAIEVKSVTRRELFCLTRRPTRPERFFPAKAADAPLVIHTRSDVDRLFVEGELGERLFAWRNDKPFIWSVLQEPARLRAFLEAELRADQFTRLSASSADKTRRTPLSKVFMDLRIAVNHPNFKGVHQSPPRFVETAQEAMAKPQPLRMRPESHHERYDRLVLMGGPGQGKTTLGVFLCQNLRSVLLKAQPGLLDETNTILRELNESHVPRPCGNRLPVRVELYRFAEKLSVCGPGYDLWSWLEEYSPHRPSDGPVITRETWRQWLCSWPSCLVFDGLDEVPPSANREALLSTIKAFVAELEAAGADVFVVVTTRPQGYRDELRSEGWIHYGLLNLQSEDALEYAGQLYGQWHREDSFLRAELVKRLERTINERSTSVLAKSPLQVTILCVLIEQLGHAPKDRWRLFREYYRIIFERERERGIESVEILREQQELVERLHAEVGYRLQLADELKGGGGGAMNPEALKRLVYDLLEEERHTGDALHSLAERIIRAALDRLVFLVGHSEDKVGFEIRALQEFFAAERLLRGEERLLEERLVAVATSAHWQNVVLFAAGRIVAERDVLLPALVRVCEQVGSFQDGLGNEAGLGPRLAVRLLAETGATNRPKVMIPLRDMVFSNMNTLPLNSAVDLIQILMQNKSKEIISLLSQHATDNTQANLAFTVLADLSIEGHEDATRAIEMMAEHHAHPLATLQLLPRRRRVGQLSPRLERAFASIGPSLLDSFTPTALWKDFLHIREEVVLPIEDLRKHRKDPHLHSLLVRFFVTGTDLASYYVSANPTLHNHHFEAYRKLIEESPIRLFEVLLAYFAQPGSTGLANALRISRVLPHPTRVWLGLQSPWPLEQCLLVPDSMIDAVIQHIESGELGDLNDWLSAEARWAKDGISINELCQPANLTRPIAPTLAISGAPNYVFTTKFPAKVFEQLPEELPATSLKALCSRMFTYVSYPLDDSISDAELHERSEFRSLMELGPSNKIWDFFVDSRAATPVSLTLLRASTNAAEWHLWRPRILRLCAQILDNERFMGEFSMGPLLLRRIHSLIVQHPNQPDLVSLSDLIGSHRIGVGSLAPLELLLDTVQDHRLLLRALVLRATTVSPDQAGPLAVIIAGCADQVADTLDRIVRILRTHRPPGALQLLKELLRLLPGPKVGHEELLYDLLTALPSGVQSFELAKRLELPTDGLQHNITESIEAEFLPAKLVWLKQVTLTNLRAWGAATFNFSAPDADNGQWVFLVGDNGAGKTTFLRAVALSLMQDGVASRVLSQTYGTLVKNGAESGEASVTLNDDTTWRVRLQRDGQVDRKSGVQDFVVGYGPRRGTILGVTEREMNFAPGEELETLFVEGGNLIHAPSWLKRQHHRSMVPESPADKHLLPAVLSVLKRVLPGVDSIEVSPDEIRVKGERVGDTTIEAMSDGYLTTAGWVVDLMARWLERERVAKHPIPNNFNEIMTGLVLLDEVDLHLHPRWQWSLIEQVRALFPRLSFIVSTHNPLTLLGSKEGEVFVIDRNHAGELVATARPLPDGATVEQLLTGEWFGLPSTLDRETRDLLDQHRAALRQDPEGAEAKRLETELRRRLGTYLDLPLERQAQGIVAEVLDAKSQNISVEERRRARRAALERLRGGNGGTS